MLGGLYHVWTAHYRGAVSEQLRLIKFLVIRGGKEMVQMTDGLELAELNNNESRENCRLRRPKAVRRHSRPMKTKKSNWNGGIQNGGIQRRRNKRLVW